MCLDKLALQLTFKTYRKSAFYESCDASESSKLWGSRCFYSFKNDTLSFRDVKKKNTAVNKNSPPLRKLQVLRSSRSFRSIINVKSRS